MPPGPTQELDEAAVSERGNGCDLGAGRDGGEQRVAPVAVAVLARVEVVGAELPGPGRQEVGGHLGDRQATDGGGLTDGLVDPGHVGDAGPAEDAPDPGGQREGGRERPTPAPREAAAAARG